MAPPNRKHQDILSYLHTEISIYIRSKNGSCKVYPAPFAVKLKEDGTIVEPDISVICSSDKLTDRNCTGAPDWIIEIVSPENPSHDYVKKLNLYMAAGVREYWISDTSDWLRAGLFLLFWLPDAGDCTLVQDLAVAEAVPISCCFIKIYEHLYFCGVPTLLSLNTSFLFAYKIYKSKQFFKN